MCEMYENVAKVSFVHTFSSNLIQRFSVTWRVRSQKIQRESWFNFRSTQQYWSHLKKRLAREMCCPYSTIDSRNFLINSENRTRKLPLWKGLQAEKRTFLALVRMIWIWTDIVYKICDGLWSSRFLLQNAACPFEFPHKIINLVMQLYY